MSRVHRPSAYVTAFVLFVALSVAKGSASAPAASVQGHVYGHPVDLDPVLARLGDPVARERLNREQSTCQKPLDCLSGAVG